MNTKTTEQKNNKRIRVHKYPLKGGIKRSPKFAEKGLAEFAVNVGTKCGHDCIYCSTGAMLRMHQSFKEASENPFGHGYAIIDPDMPERVAHDAARIQNRGMVQLCTTVADVCEISGRIVARGSLPEITSEDLQEREDAAKMEELYKKWGGAWLMQMCEKYAVKTFPSNPEEFYKDKGWKGWDDFLGLPMGTTLLQAVEKQAEELVEYNNPEDYKVLVETLSSVQKRVREIKTEVKQGCKWWDNFEKVEKIGLANLVVGSDLYKWAKRQAREM